MGSPTHEDHAAQPAPALRESLCVFRFRAPSSVASIHQRSSRVTKYPHGRAPTISGRHTPSVHGPHEPPRPPSPRRDRLGGEFPGELCRPLFERAANAFPRTSGPITATVQYRIRTPNRQRCSSTGKSRRLARGGDRHTVPLPPRQTSGRCFCFGGDAEQQQLHSGARNRARFALPF